jgi:hypothetical protein
MEYANSVRMVLDGFGKTMPIQAQVSYFGVELAAAIAIGKKEGATAVVTIMWALKLGRIPVAARWVLQEGFEQTWFGEDVTRKLREMFGPKYTDVRDKVAEAAGKIQDETRANFMMALRTDRPAGARWDDLRLGRVK